MASYRFDRFSFDPADRRLWCDDRAVDLNSRYLDALALLVRERGKLVSKNRFLDEVWQGVPVTDEALTQCIKILRRQLGDDAAEPRFIETVPKHGYRFVADVAMDGEGPRRSKAGAPSLTKGQAILLLGAAGTIGGGFAGLAGGLFYGFAGASQPLAPGMGAVSVMLILICLTTLVALIGGAGVAFGIAAAGFGSGRPSPWIIGGGALGGLIVGAITKLLGLDAFQLLLGQSPGDITGAAEGLALGSSVGLGAWLASSGQYRQSIRRCSATAALIAGVAGLVIVSIGGELMGGSLELLSQSMPGSRLRLDQLGHLVGEATFGPVSRLITGALEGALFGGCLVAAMLLARRHLAIGEHGMS